MMEMSFVLMVSPMSITGDIAAAPDNGDKSAFKALGTTVELQNSTEPLAKVLQYDAADTYAVGEVVYNDRDGNYYLAAGSTAALWTGNTTALNQTDEIDTNAGEFVKLGSDLASVADHAAWDSGKNYNQGDIVSFRDSAGKMRLYVATSATSGGACRILNLMVQPAGPNCLNTRQRVPTYSIPAASYPTTAYLTLLTSSKTLATARAQNGAEAKHLQYADEMLVQNRTNLEAANSRIKDVDVAMESTNYAKQNILVQSSAAMLAQANTLSSIALSLLGQ